MVLTKDTEKSSKKYLVEFGNYKDAKAAKDSLAEAYDNELVQVDSGLHQVYIKAIFLNMKKIQS
jgi:hypothetical protein